MLAIALAAAASQKLVAAGEVAYTALGSVSSFEI